MTDTTIASFRTLTFDDQFTRANDTTAYAARDAILSATGTTFILGDANPSGPSLNDENYPLREESETWSGEINTITLVTTLSTTAFAGRLWLFTANPTGQTDNEPVAFTPAFIKDHLITAIEFEAADMTQINTASMFFHKRNIDAPFNFLKNHTGVDGRIWCVLEADGDFTPAAQMVFHLKLTLTQD